MRPSFLCGDVLKTNGTSDTVTCRHVCANSACVSQRVSASSIVARLTRKRRISLLQTCIGRNVQRGTESWWSWFDMTWCIFRKDNNVSKRSSHFRPHWPWPFDLVIWKLLCRLLLTCLKFNVVWYAVFELTIDTGQTDRRTDGRGVTRNAASYGGPPHNDNNNNRPNMMMMMMMMMMMRVELIRMTHI